MADPNRLGVVVVGGVVVEVVVSCLAPVRRLVRGASAVWVVTSE